MSYAPVTGISSITYTGPASLDASDTATVSATISPVGANPVVLYTSSDTNVATVDASGIVRPVNGGTATITATAAGDSTKKSTYDVTVYIPLRDICGLNINPNESYIHFDNVSNEYRIVNGYTTDTYMTPIFQPSNTNEKNIGYYLSEDVNAPSLNATIIIEASSFREYYDTANSGILLYGQSVGLTNLSLTSDNSNISQKIYTIRTYDLDLSITGNSSLVLGYSTLQLGATYSEYAKPGVSWSSANTAIATVDASGLVSGVAAGTTTITITHTTTGITATKEITVANDIPLTALDFTTNKTPLTTSPNYFQLYTNETLQITPVYTPSNVTNKSIIYQSSNENVATVDASGLVTPNQSISGDYLNQNATIYIIGTNGKSTSILIDRVRIGVNSLAGATLEGVEVPGVYISIENNEIRLLNGYRGYFSTILNPTNAFNKYINISVPNTNIVSFRGESSEKNELTNIYATSSEELISKSVGTTTITYTSVQNPSVTYNQTVRVYDLDLGITGGSTAIIGYADLQLGASLSQYAEQTVSWSSANDAIATVDASGRVVGVAEGTTTITLTHTVTGLTATKEVTIAPFVNVTAVGFINIAGSPQPQLNMNGDDGYNIARDVSGATFRTVFSPSNATDKRVTYSSSDSSVISIDASGALTVHATTGSAIITGRSMSNTAVYESILFTIITDVSGMAPITYDGPVILYPGDHAQFSSHVLPLDATNQGFWWSSGDDNIITIDASGYATAVGPGTTTITAGSNENIWKRATYSVTVTVINVQSIAIQPRISLSSGASIDLDALITPQNATNPAITWSSDASGVATVDSSGIVTAVSVGSATIRAHSVQNNSISASTIITVVSGPVVSKSVEGVNYIGNTSYTSTLMATNTLQLESSVYPSDATNQALDWSSSDTAIATIDASGLVTGIYPGSATITAAASADNTKSKIFPLTVTKKPVTGILDISAAGVYVDASGTNTIQLNRTLQLTTGVIPSDASYKGITWSTSDAATATVDASGVVTGRKISAGTSRVTITGRTQDGNFSKTIQFKIVPVAVTGLDISGAATMGATATNQLVATVSPNDAAKTTIASWTIAARPSVATIGNIATISRTGLVTAKGPGYVTVTATTTGKKIDSVTSQTQTFNITCGVPLESLAPIDISGAPAADASGAITLKHGQRYAVRTSTIPANATNQGVTWQVSASSLGSVTNGILFVNVNNTANRSFNLRALPTKTEYLLNGTQVGSTTQIINVAVDVASVAITPTAAQNVNMGAKIGPFRGTVSPVFADNSGVILSVVDASGSASSLATLDASGMLTGVSEGICFVRATSAADSSKTARVQVTVKKNSVTRVTISPSTSSVKKGQTVTLTATVEPTNATYPLPITWSIATGTGSIVSAGSNSYSATFTASATTTGTVKIRASADGVASAAQATITVTA